MHEVRSMEAKMGADAYRGAAEVYRRTTTQEEETLYIKEQYGEGEGEGEGGAEVTRSKI